jgi:hypothetical protein
MPGHKKKPMKKTAKKVAAKKVKIKMNRKKY